MNSIMLEEKITNYKKIIIFGVSIIISCIGLYLIIETIDINNTNSNMLVNITNVKKNGFN